MHFHAKSVQWVTRKTDVLPLLPADMLAADMIADRPGLACYSRAIAERRNSTWIGRLSMLAY